MRAVLYAYDLEPITVIELPPGAVEFLKFNGSVKLSVPTMPPVTMPLEQTPIQYSFKIIEIMAERFVYRNAETLILFTADEETALEMKAAFLSGQVGAVQALQRNAFAYGFMTAIRKLGAS